MRKWTLAGDSERNITTTKQKLLESINNELFGETSSYSNINISQQLTN